MCTFSNLSFEQSFFKYRSFDLVSMRKMIEGDIFFTNSVSFETAHDCPKPRQFQLIQFIALGRADPQPPPLQKRHLCYHGRIVGIWKEDWNIYPLSQLLFSSPRSIQRVQLKACFIHMFFESKWGEHGIVVLSLEP